MLKEKMRDDKTVSEKIRKTYIDDRDNRTSISSIVSMYRKLESFFFHDSERETISSCRIARRTLALFLSFFSRRRNVFPLKS